MDPKSLLAPLQPFFDLLGVEPWMLGLVVLFGIVHQYLKGTVPAWTSRLSLLSAAAWGGVFGGLEWVQHQRGPLDGGKSVAVLIVACLLAEGVTALAAIVAPFIPTNNEWTRPKAGPSLPPNPGGFMRTHLAVLLAGALLLLSFGLARASSLKDAVFANVGAAQTWFPDGSAGYRMDSEGSACIGLSLQPHLSVANFFNYGFTQALLRDEAEVRLTCSDVDDRTFSVDLLLGRQFTSEHAGGPTGYYGGVSAGKSFAALPRFVFGGKAARIFDTGETRVSLKAAYVLKNAQ